MLRSSEWETQKGGREASTTSGAGIKEGKWALQRPADTLWPDIEGRVGRWPSGQGSQSFQPKGTAGTRQGITEGTGHGGKGEHPREVRAPVGATEAGWDHQLGGNAKVRAELCKSPPLGTQPDQTVLVSRRERSLKTAGGRVWLWGSCGFCLSVLEET